MPRKIDKFSHRQELREMLDRGTEDHYSDPLLYDIEYNDYEQDVRWYQDFAKERCGENGILEIGCGSGRVTVELAKDGHNITGLDRMQPMLDSNQAKLNAENLNDNVKLVCGDIRNLPFEDETFDAVICPFNTLMHLYTWEDILQCFQEVHRVLVPGGSFGFDVLVPDIEWLSMDSNERQCEGRFLHPTLGKTMVYSTNHTYDTETQVCHIRIFHDSNLDGERFGIEPSPSETLIRLAHRQIFPEEIRMLTTVAKFRLENLSGDFLGISLNSDVESQIAICSKPTKRAGSK